MKYYIIVSILLFIILIGILFIISNKSIENQGLYQESGICPNCGSKLVKGIYGCYRPQIIWYCPEC